MRPCSATLILLVSASTILAAESSVDLRLRVGLSPGVSEVEQRSDTLGTSETSVDAADGISIAPTLVCTKMFNDTVGMVYGGELFWRSHEWEYQGESGGYEAIGAGLLLGAAIRLGPQVQIEMTPFLDVGIGQETYDTGSGGGTDNGPYLAYGVTLGGWFALTSNLLVGAEIGYMAGRGEASYTPSGSPGSKTDWIDRFDGMTANLGVGYRF